MCIQESTAFNVIGNNNKKIAAMAKFHNKNKENKIEMKMMESIALASARVTKPREEPPN